MCPSGRVLPGAVLAWLLVGWGHIAFLGDRSHVSVAVFAGPVYGAVAGRDAHVTEGLFEECYVHEERVFEFRGCERAEVGGVA